MNIEKSSISESSECEQLEVDNYDLIFRLLQKIQIRNRSSNVNILSFDDETHVQVNQETNKFNQKLSEQRPKRYEKTRRSENDNN